MQKLEKSHSGDDCVFNRLSPHGVISFSDFLFLYTLLSSNFSYLYLNNSRIVKIFLVNKNAIFQFYKSSYSSF